MKIQPIPTHTFLMLDFTQQRIIKYVLQKGEKNFSLVQTIMHIITTYQTKIRHNSVGTILINTTEKLNKFVAHLNSDQTLLKMLPAD
ncbi:hypothetical protein G9A89_010753 [Geosiphon pyriformis]|nr:hypothetical protein G9A89_010753 [Geosiphon pyriformis]